MHTQPGGFARALLPLLALPLVGAGGCASEAAPDADEGRAAAALAGDSAASACTPLTLASLADARFDGAGSRDRQDSYRDPDTLECVSDEWTETFARPYFLWKEGDQYLFSADFKERFFATPLRLVSASRAQVAFDAYESNAWADPNTICPEFFDSGFGTSLDGTLKIYVALGTGKLTLERHCVYNETGGCFAPQDTIDEAAQGPVVCAP